MKTNYSNKNELSLFDDMHFVNTVDSFSNRTNLRRKATPNLAKL